MDYPELELTKNGSTWKMAGKNRWDVTLKGKDAEVVFKIYSERKQHNKSVTKHQIIQELCIAAFKALQVEKKIRELTLEILKVKTASDFKNLSKTWASFMRSQEVNFWFMNPPILEILDSNPSKTKEHFEEALMELTYKIEYWYSKTKYSYRI
jgi:hypothetical protein